MQAVIAFLFVFSVIVIIHEFGHYYFVKKAGILISEGEGLHKKVLAKSDEIVGIKMKNDWDSLNVSAAFAILCDRIINE